MPVVFDPHEAGGLLGHFARAISGSAIARGVSFLKERMGETVFAPSVTLIDDPLDPRGFRSRPFDDEGCPSRALTVIEQELP